MVFGWGSVRTLAVWLVRGISAFMGYPRDWPYANQTLENIEFGEKTDEESLDSHSCSGDMTISLDEPPRKIGVQSNRALAPRRRHSLATTVLRTQKKSSRLRAPRHSVGVVR